MIYNFVLIEYKQADQKETELAYGILAHNNTQLFDRSFTPITKEAFKSLTTPIKLLRYMLMIEPATYRDVFSIEEDDQNVFVKTRKNIIVHMNGVKYCYSPS